MMFDDLKQSKTNIGPVDANRAFTICELILYRLRDKAGGEAETQQKGKRTKTRPTPYTRSL